MKDKRLIVDGLMNSLGIAAYVVCLSLVLRNGEKIFGKMDNFLGPAIFLLIFVLSATITGSLMFGRPAVLYLDGRKTEAIKLLFYTVGLLLVITAIFLVVRMLR